MDSMTPRPFDAAPDESGGLAAFGFEGSWREFAPIAFTNLLLTIVTLGMYRFWATARERRYLWARTRFIDENLEWTGTGKELLFGFLIVLSLFGIPYIVLQFVVQALMLQGKEAWGAALTVAMLLLIFYLIGVARFRALRYRLARTHWRGIRGGSDHNGFRYGWSYMWRTTLGYLAMGLMVPWAMVSLWNQRWRAMSFGPLEFDCAADFSPLMKRYLLFYLSPIVVLVVGLVVGAGLFFSFGRAMTDNPGEAAALGMVAVVIAGLIGFYLVIGFVWLAYFAKFFRVVVGEMTLGDLEFAFTARTKDWFKLILGDMALVLFTLGIGYIFLTYRHWSFFIRHMAAYGTINVDELTQSTTRMARHGEGLLDAFDVGAI